MRRVIRVEGCREGTAYAGGERGFQRAASALWADSNGGEEAAGSQRVGLFPVSSRSLPHLTATGFQFLD